MLRQCERLITAWLQVRVLPGPPPTRCGCSSVRDSEFVCVISKTLLSGFAASGGFELAYQTIWKALGQLGWERDRSLQVDLRFGDGDVERIRQFAMEFVALQPDVLIGDGTRRREHCDARPARFRLSFSQSEIRSGRERNRRPEGRRRWTPAGGPHARAERLHATRRRPSR
jgi:PAS domain-containing protein